MLYFSDLVHKKLNISNEGLRMIIMHYVHIYSMIPAGKKSFSVFLFLNAISDTSQH